MLAEEGVTVLKGLARGLPHCGEAQKHVWKISSHEKNKKNPNVFVKAPPSWGGARVKVLTVPAGPGEPVQHHSPAPRCWAPAECTTLSRLHSSTFQALLPLDSLQAATSSHSQKRSRGP